MIPYTVERRPDTGVTNVALGIWLFLASEVMLFGALFSAYALLRVSAPEWPVGREVLGVRGGVINTVVLIAASSVVWWARARPAASARVALLASSIAAMAFLALKTLEYRSEFGHGLTPAGSTFLATYFVLTGLHAAHVAGGLIANVWIALGAGRVSDKMTAGRVSAAWLYWTFVDVVWAIIFVLVYLT